MSKVKIINSVDEYVAGEEVELDDAKAIRFIILGYAEGEIVQELSDKERAEIESTAQVVSLGA